MTDFVTHSLLKTFDRCPRVAMYKYHDSIAPRTMSKPLQRGIWFHDLLDVFYTFGGWEGAPESMDMVRAKHAEYTSEFRKLMDEEKDRLGDLPTELWRLFVAYLWHYRKDTGWRVLESEIKLEGVLPNGIDVQGKIDLIVEDEFGVWLVDHKTHARIPSLIQRILDRQSVIYLWLALEMGIKAEGFIWNYVKTEAPHRIRFTKGNTKQPPRIVANQGATDYWTARTSIKKTHPELFDREDIQEFLRPLARQRFDPTRGVQTSPFFIRERFERDDDMMVRALAGAMRTADEFVNYDFTDRDSVKRVNDRSCDWCAYRNPCTTELIGGSIDNMMRQEFVQADPFGYYDRPEAAAV